MFDWPGWNSLDTVSRIHSLSEIAGIALLAMLVVAEAVTFKYGGRRDTLLTLQEEEDKRAHDQEIARLHNETALATAEAAKLGVSFGNLHDFVADQERQNNVAIAELRKDTAGLGKAREDALAAAEGTKRTLADMSDLLDKQKALQQQMIAAMKQREISPEQRKKFSQNLKQFHGIGVDIFLIAAPSADAAPLSHAVLEILANAQWRTRGVTNLLGATGFAGVAVMIEQNSNAHVAEAASVLIADLSAAGVSAHLDRPFSGNPVETLGAFVGAAGGSPPSDIWIVIGSKP